MSESSISLQNGTCHSCVFMNCQKNEPEELKNDLSVKENRGSKCDNTKVQVLSSGKHSSYKNAFSAVDGCGDEKRKRS